MLFLALTILLNAYLSVVFKLFQRFGVDAFSAIVVNYLVCAVTGSVVLGAFPIGAVSLQQPWLPWAMGLGCGFIAVFSLTAWSTRADGITATTVANKLSLVIPVVAAFLLYAGERFHWTKAAGIACALPAVYLSAQSGTCEGPNRSRAWLAPVLLFFGSGALDTVVTYVTRTFFSGQDALRSQSVYLVHTFATAGLIGAAVLGVQLLAGKRRWAWRNALGGVLLGVPNYFSIYYLLRLLSDGLLQPSVAIPVVNIGVVVAAALCAIFFFGEKATRHRWTGLALAVLAILLLAYSDLIHAG